MSRRLTEPIEPPAPRDGTTVVAVVALGSNLGDREATLRSAVAAITRLPLVDAVTVSDAVESVALTVDGLDPDAPAYLNAVALVTTRLAPTVLLGFLQSIEADHGRAPRDPDTRRWADRTLDLDLIAYGDVRSDAADLTLPHPRAASRDFVLVPWLSVDPDAHLPGHGRVDVLVPGLRGEG